jgi:hypothetical protein
MLYLVQATQKNQAPPLVVRLRRALLRARIVVEEAEARQVTNRAMLLQLNQLRGEMCRGSYVLDAFMRRAVDDPSRGSPAGLPELLESGRTRTGGQVVSAVVNTLEAALSDMTEFVVLLGACPRLNRQPYCATCSWRGACLAGRWRRSRSSDSCYSLSLRKISMSSRSLALTRSGSGRWSSMPVSMTGCEITSPRFTISQVTILIYRAMTTMAIIKVDRLRFRCNIRD